MIGTQKIVALCTSRIFDPLTHGFIETLNEYLTGIDCVMWVYALNADLYWNGESVPAEAAVFEHIPYDQVDAVVLMDEKIKSHLVSDDIISRASKAGVPVIVVDGTYDNTIGIFFDYRKGFEAVVRHVIEDHHITRPHFMAGIVGNKFSDERLEVFKEVLADNGIEFRDDMVSYGEFWAVPARAAAEEILKRDTLPQAVICGNDIMAINVCDVFKNAGISIPDEVLITGFDGYDEAFMSTPGIATVNCDVTLLAKEAGRAVSDCIEKKSKDAYYVVPELVKNESCGCPRCADISNSIALKRFNTNFYRYQDDIRMVHDTTAKMLGQDSMEHCIGCIRSWFTRFVWSCIVDSDCLRSDINFFLEDGRSGRYSLIYDGTIEEDRVSDFDTDNVVPHLNELLGAHFPPVFQSLDYMDKHMGYICYSFPDYEITEYAKSTAITDMISAGLGGYINMRCQHYLINKVQEMYKIDALTGLYNRMAFREAFDELKNDPANEGKPLTVIMADLNHLKQINDTLGHEAGDKAIASVADALKSSCPPDTLFVRFGGDEMLSFIPGKCDVPVILDRVGEILKESSDRFGFEISASCGTYETAISADINFEDALKHADESMYIEKLRSRGEQ